MGDHFSGVAEEGEELTGRTSLAESSLQNLQKFSELFQLLPCREAEKPSNQPKNRKPGILPGTRGRAGQPLALRSTAQEQCMGMMLPCSSPPQHYATGRFCPGSNCHFLVGKKYRLGWSLHGSKTPIPASFWASCRHVFIGHTWDKHLMEDPIWGLSLIHI